MMKFNSSFGFNPEIFSKYYKNTIWLMFGKISSLLVGLIVARYLGPHFFGELNFGIAFVSILASFGTLGLDTIIVREIIKSPSKRDEILGTSLGLRVIANLLLVPATILLYLAIYGSSPNSDPPLLILICLLSFASCFKSFNVIDSYFQSQIRSKDVVLVQNICLLLSAVIKVIIVSSNLPLVYIALALVIDGLMLAAGLVIIYQNQDLNIFHWTFHKKRAKSLLIQSSPLILSGVMISIYMKIDIVMLKNFGSDAVGIYSAAANISEAWYFIPIAIVTSVFPALIYAKKTDVERYHRRLKDLYDLLIFICLPIAFVISFTSDKIVNILYSNEFNSAGTILSIHIWSGIFVFFGTASSQYLIAEGYTKISFYRTTLGAIVNVLLNLWLIPEYSGIGASIATLIACIVSTFFLLLIPKTQKHGIVMLRSLFLINLYQRTVKLLN